MQTGSPHVTYQSSAPVPASPSRFPDPAFVAALIPQARLVARIATKADRMPSSSSCLQKGDHRSKDSLGRFFGQEMSAIETCLHAHRPTEYIMIAARARSV